MVQSGKNSEARKPSEVLRGALNILETKGWYKGRYYAPETGCYCSLGALGQVVTGNPQAIASKYQQNVDMSRALELLAYVTKKDILVWNDAPERTFPEVQVAFNRAIALAEAAGE